MNRHGELHDAIAAFCAAHGNNAYATGPYTLGLTQTGNPELDPEESTSFTAGLVIEPMRNLSFTLDYWHIEVEGLITGVTDTSAAEAAYYANNGVVNIPGIMVLAGRSRSGVPECAAGAGLHRDVVRQPGQAGGQRRRLRREPDRAARATR